MNDTIRGLWPAILTPVGPEGAPDAPRALAHARRLIEAGCDGVALFGTTGEGTAFSVAERTALLDALLAGAIPPERILVATGACALADAIALGRHASARGCHRQLFLPPFYFRQPRRDGVIASVTELIEGIGDASLRLLLYHIPGLSSVVFDAACVAALARRHPTQVIGVKDSSGDLAHAQSLVRAFPTLAILVGAEADVAPTMRVGGAGSVNGLANLAPRLMRRIIDRPQAVGEADARLLSDLLALLNIRPDMPFVSVYKTLLAEQSGDESWCRVRAPLTPLDPDESRAVRTGFRSIGARLDLI